MYFQNPTDSDFYGSLVLGDRQFSMMFKVKGDSPNSSELLLGWNHEPFNVSVNKNLTINYSLNSGYSWTPLTIDVSTHAANTAAALASEVVAALNADSTFPTIFTAFVKGNQSPSLSSQNYVTIQAIKPREMFKAYISNGGAEEILRFNKKAGVAEIPSYFARHTIANKYIYPDSTGQLVQLDPTTAQDQQIISEAGLAYNISVNSGSPNVTVQNTNLFAVGDSVVVYDSSHVLSTTIMTISSATAMVLSNNWTGSTETATMIDIRADYQLFRGRSGIFNFQNVTVDGSDRITTIIEYPAGALPGDLARKIQYVYSGANTHPSSITEIPYVLTSADLITP